ncbi:MAG: tRNA preQ1(34) S-adenosylmethionine ribosyltransferase-isomerase QueA [Aphanocapsa lilacina HA4352-LM1]|jgi:S-adenosylmethionine:tRNA ribosyltransferase-isomerase|nr:tRNA preQ1(34) S-adenosylmethionine ribosyltransferase-isomerase QueA [Aphanocapsa lilacina HA4352-LM1]
MNAPIDARDFLTDSYDYALPEHCIAQQPAEPRDHSRLLVVGGEAHTHRCFYDLPGLLQPGDLLILNDTRVIPARLFGSKASGGRVEVLLLEPRAPREWLCLVKPARRLAVGARIDFDGVLAAQVTELDAETGGRWLRFEAQEDFEAALDRVGHTPLPPYLKASRARDERYQTVWASRPGAVAAPTAGLHFSGELLDRLAERGIERATLTLHVGLGTFRPVQTESIHAHRMHREWYEIPEATVLAIERTRAHGGRVIAVGTTSARALESAAQPLGLPAVGPGRSELFIYPGYRWRIVEGLITNFHLPRSSLLMLVSSLMGRERLLALYREAIDKGYRFYSFGDAMLILPGTEA